MNIIAEITKNTYDITFSSEVDYEWHKIAELFVTSDDVYNDLNNKALISKNESKEKVLYWQDMFFMEAVENRKKLPENNKLVEKLRSHPLYLSNLKFINELPLVTKGLGRELFIDTMIANKNADELISDEMLGDVIKKKSREELRRKLDEWGDEISELNDGEYVIFKDDYIHNASYHKMKDEKLYEDIKNPKGRQNNTKNRIKSYIIYLAAACFIGAIAFIGYFSVSNSYDFNDTEFVESSKTKLLKGTGLGFSNDTNIDSVTIRIFNYKKADSVEGRISDDLRRGTYLFTPKDLKLVLLEENTKNIQLLELEKDSFYLKINKDYFRIIESDEFQNLNKLKNQKLILELERIIFENE